MSGKDTKKTGKKKCVTQRKAVQVALLGALYKGGDELGELADRYGLSLRRLAEWAAQAWVVEAMRLIRRLDDERTSLEVRSARVAAARSLRRLATEGSAAETARKACVDLLKMEPSAGDETGDGSVPDKPLAIEDPERYAEVQNLLEAIGKACEPGEDDDDEYTGVSAG